MSGSVLRTRRACALCESVDLKDVLSLPATPLANEFSRLKDEQETFPLALQLCGSCGHVQLAHVVDPRRLFDNYVYVSGTSPVFVKHFDDYARDVSWRLCLNEHSKIVDIGSNDGTFLKSFKKLGMHNVAGVEPAERIATGCGIQHVLGYFDRSMAAHIRKTFGAVNLVTANNVFAHADDLKEIALGVRDLLAPEGEFVFEVSYLKDVVEKLLFDTIYHEHLSYHTVAPLIPFLKACGLTLYHAKPVPTHGGSIRVFASRARKPETPELSQILLEERRAQLDQPDTFFDFRERIHKKGEELRTLIKAWKAAGKKICGYGAPAKLTTLMYAFDLQAEDFEFIVEDSPMKQSHFTPGKHIPVKPPFSLLDEKTDVCIVFAWNFFDSIVAKNEPYLRAGGRFINPLDVPK